jgi:hypothetical protein
VVNKTNLDANYVSHSGRTLKSQKVKFQFEKCTKSWY